MRWAFADRTTDEVARWWDERPCNSRNSTFPVGSRSYFTQIARRKYRSEPHLLPFVDPEHLVGASVLEVGCGVGTVTTDVSFHAREVRALDVSARSVELAEQNVALRGVPHVVTLVRADVEDPRIVRWLPRAHFDCILSWGVLHHTPRPDVALNHLRLLAKDDTELRIMLYHRWSSKALRLGLLDRLVARGSEARRGSPVTYTFSRRRARKLLRATGWEVKEMWVDHIFHWQGEAYGRGEYVVARPWRWVPARWFHKLERRFGWHLLIVAIPR